MASPQRTQKQIAERFRGGLDYFKKPHYLRRAKFLTAFAVFVVGLAAVILYQFLGRPVFFNSGPISQPHAGIAHQCEACHLPPGLARLGASDHSPVDLACQKCHAHHTLHEPNVVQEHSCTACHREHQGAGLMHAVDNANCAACHADAAIMHASAEKGAGLPASAFAARPPRGLVQFVTARPATGYTAAFAGFANGHPEFQLQREHQRDPDTLKFNHQLHLSDAVPPLNGRKLECADCHQADATGAYQRRVNYAAHCQSCHALQFDAGAPGLVLPHGQPEFVRAFLHSLPTQYADHARRAQGLVTQEAVDAYVNAQIRRLQAVARSGELLEEQIFSSDGKAMPIATTGQLAGPGRAQFAGCAYCHEVTRAADGRPQVTRPVLIERWLTHGTFDHAQHRASRCTDCHAASASRDTADIILPTQASCVVCHSPGKRARADCTTCHRYHAGK